MTPRGAALVAVLFLIALGAFAGWLVGVPLPFICAVAGLSVVIALRRILRRRAPPKDAKKIPH